MLTLRCGSQKRPQAFSMLGAGFYVLLCDPWCLSYKRKCARTWDREESKPIPTMVNVLKRRSQRLSRRKETLISKSHEIATLCDVDVALFLRIRKTGRIITYKSLNLESWPPSREQMVIYYPNYRETFTNRESAPHLPSSTVFISKRH